MSVTTDVPAGGRVRVVGEVCAALPVTPEVAAVEASGSAGNVTEIGTVENTDKAEGGGGSGGGAGGGGGGVGAACNGVPENLLSKIMTKS